MNVLQLSFLTIIIENYSGDKKMLFLFVTVLFQVYERSAINHLYCFVFLYPLIQKII